MKLRYHQETEPQNPLADSYNVPLEVGQKVAYNYSGEVRLGTIMELKAVWKKTRQGMGNAYWWHLDTKIKIEEITGLTSLIRNPNGIVVLK